MKRKSNYISQSNNSKYYKLNIEKIETLDDLINIGQSYNNYLESSKYIKSNKNINLDKLGRIVSSLIKLNNLVGMAEVKKNIIDHILYFIQDYQYNNEDLLHIVIQGPPGTGKTELGRILGEIYYNLDIIKKPKKKHQKNSRILFNDDYNDDYNEDDKPVEPEMIFKIVSRSDLIAGYLGQTAIKTQKVIDSCLGGVLFIDEAYSLGSESRYDSYAKECIDTLNLNLTEKKNQLLVIIAGYKNELQQCFFNYNSGLERRFPFIYEIEKYNYKELFDIFKYKLKNDKEWIYDDTVDEIFFKDNINYFPNYGGDIEIFIFSCKIKHARRLFKDFIETNKRETNKILNKEDLEEALKILKKRNEEKNRENYRTMFI